MGLQWTDGTPLTLEDRVALTTMGRLALLTTRQRETLQAIVTYYREFGYYPSIRETGLMLGITSSSTVHYHWVALERKGLVERVGPRAVRLILEEELPSDPGFLAQLDMNRDRLAKQHALGRSR